MSIKVFAIVRREDYGHLRQLLPELPSKSGTWIEQRFAARLEFENASSLKAKMQIIDPAAFAHFCSTNGNQPESASAVWYGSRS